jgi:hypothetical protein
MGALQGIAGVASASEELPLDGPALAQGTFGLYHQVEKISFF